MTVNKLIEDMSLTTFSLSDPEAMMRRIERSIDDYCSAFWKLDANTKRKYLAEQAASFGTSKKLSEVWKEPSASDKQKMIDKMKTAVNSFIITMHRLIVMAIILMLVMKMLDDQESVLVNMKMVITLLFLLMEIKMVMVV